jgi:uncharacterized RDD family membrane protein YckC
MTEQTKEINTVSATESKMAPLVFRYAAMIVDGLIVGAILIPYFLFAYLMGLNEESTLTTIIEALTVFIYSVYQIQKYQMTWGKKYFNLKVVTLDGGEMTLGRAIKREVLGKLLSNILGLGYIWALFNKKRQSWHDLLAKTIVVQTEEINKGKKILAYFLAFGLAGPVIIVIIAMLVLVSVNPMKSVQRARDQQQKLEQMMLQRQQEYQDTFSPSVYPTSQIQDN